MGEEKHGARGKIDGRAEQGRDDATTLQRYGSSDVRCEGYNDEGGQGEYDIRYNNYGHIRGAKAGDGQRAAGGEEAVQLDLVISRACTRSLYSPGTGQDKDKVKEIKVATEVSEQGEGEEG